MCKYAEYMLYVHKDMHTWNMHVFCVEIRNVKVYSVVLMNTAALNGSGADPLFLDSFCLVTTRPTYVQIINKYVSK